MASQYLARLGIVLGVDSGELVQGINAAKKQFKDFSNQVEKDTKAAAREFDSLKTATEDYGRTLTKVEQIQREIERGRFMFASQNVKDRLLEQAKAYDAQAAAMKKTTGALTEQQKMQVGFQLTDFFTQIASGQNAMIAFIQQGGQLKDTMGGIGNAVRALTSYITPFSVALGSVAAAIGSVAYAFITAEKQSANLRDALILTGNTAGTTQAQIVALSNVLASDLSVSYSKANDVLLALVSSGKFSAQTFDVMGRAIIQFSKLAGVDAKEAAEKLMNAFDGTAASAKSLNNQYGFLTLSQYRQIEALERQGKAQEAIEIGSKAFLQSIEEQERKLGTLEKVWKALGDAVEYAKNALLSFGRDTDQDKLLELARKIEITASNVGGTDTESIANRSKNKQLLQQQIQEYTDLAKKMQDDMLKAETDAEKKREEKRKIDLYGRSGGLQSQIQVQREAQKAQIEAYFKVAEEVANEAQMIEIELQKKITEAVIEEYQKNQDSFGYQAAELAKKRVAKVAEAEAEAQKQRMSLLIKNRQAQFAEETRSSTEAANATVARENETYAARSALAIRFFEEERNMLHESARLRMEAGMLGATPRELQVAKSRLDLEKQIREMKERNDIDALDKQNFEDSMRRNQELKEMNFQLIESLQRVQGMYDAVWSNMSSAIEQFVRTGKFSIKDFTRSVIQDMLIMQMRLQAMQLVRGLLGSFFAQQMGPVQGAQALPFSFSRYEQRAAGGPVSGGSPYIVGERGPEIFMPSGSGTIIPNNMLAMGSSGPSVVYNGPYIANMSAIDTQSGIQFLAKNKQAVWAANQSAQRSMPVSR